VTEQLESGYSLHPNRPDWVMIGFEWNGQCAIIASDTLSTAELTLERESRDVVSDFFTPLRREYDKGTYILNVTMERGAGFVMVSGPDYMSCLAGLAKTWNPDQSKQRRAIT
jgi:hypothetical protein